MENNNYRVVFSSDAMSDTSTYIQHYGKKGMKWGVVHEEIPGRTANSHATVFSFRGAPPRSMTGDNRIKMPTAPSESQSGPVIPAAQSASKPKDIHYQIMMDQGTNDLNYRLLQFATNSVPRSDPSRSDSQTYSEQIEYMINNPGPYQEQLDQLKAIINDRIQAAYYDKAHNLSKKYSFTEFKQDFLNTMASKYNWTGLEKLVPNSKPYQKQASESYESPAKRQTGREFAKTALQQLQRNRNSTGTWGVVRKKQVGGR